MAKINNVTFLVGNGLDLSLGMKTTYRDFYSHIKNIKPKTKNKIYGAIKDDPETWSNFELTLGTYTQYLEELAVAERQKEALLLHTDLEEVTQDLAEYLAVQDLKVGEQLSIEPLGRGSFYHELAEGQRNMIHSTLGGVTLHYDFVTLNYTSAIEKMFPTRGVLEVPGDIVIGRIHHLHGDLTEDITLGVNDESQLSSALEGDEKDDLIKPRLIASMNDGRIETFKSLINKSEIVVLFGTSLGETDKYIWEFLIDWLAAYNSRLIIIHKHDKTYTDATKRIPRRKKLFASEVQNKLLSHSELDDDERTKLRSRIYVIHNTKKLFKLK